MFYGSLSVTVEERAVVGEADNHEAGLWRMSNGGDGRLSSHDYLGAPRWGNDMEVIKRLWQNGADAVGIGGGFLDSHEVP